MRAILPIFVVFCGVATPALAAPAAAEVHPVALRRERLNRQLAHTRGRKGHR